MELLLLVFFCLLTGSEVTFGAENGRGIPDDIYREATVVKVEEGSDVTLPCSLNTTDITNKKFEWKIDGRQVFLYDDGDHSNNVITGQDQQFKGRVSYFLDELKSGNASITIRDLKAADTGNYICEFPDLQPRQIFLILLYVDEAIKGAAPKPYITSLKPKNIGEAQLLCEAHGDPQPELHWQDSDGNNLKAEEPQGGHVTLQITVKKTGDYRCVATQEKIGRKIYSETHVTVNGSSSGLVAGSVLKLFLLMVFLVFLF